MKKSDLIAQVAEKAELSKAAATRAFHALFDGTTGAIAQAVQAGEQVTIPGFGRFRPRTRKARKGRNPQTGAEIDIPERNTVQFSVGKDLRSSVGTPGTSRGKRTAGAAARAGGTKGAAKSTASAGKGGGRGAAAAGSTGALSAAAGFASSRPLSIFLRMAIRSSCSGLESFA